MATKPITLPDTFWRVSAKALVFDGDNRLLVFMDKNHEWEMPGGGWKHAETFEQCLTRELAEEARAKIIEIGRVEFCYRASTRSGQSKLCVAAKVVLAALDFVPSDDDLIKAHFVTKKEFLQLPFQVGEAPIKNYASQIWS